MKHSYQLLVHRKARLPKGGLVMQSATIGRSCALHYVMSLAYPLPTDDVEKVVEMVVVARGGMGPW